MLILSLASHNLLSCMNMAAASCSSSSLLSPLPNQTYFSPKPKSAIPIRTRKRPPTRCVQADQKPSPIPSDPIQKFLNREYKYGFVSDFESFSIPKGLSESTVRTISSLKSEPDWLLRFRLSAFARFQSMTEPSWSDNVYPPLDLDSICYYSEPKRKPKLNSLDDVDPKLIETFKKLGIPLSEQERLTNVAMDAVIDSTSIATTHRETLMKAGVIFCSISDAVKDYPELVRKYLGKVVPVGDNYYAALNSAVFSDGSFCYVPKNTVSPMEISTYFRINDRETGQFERTLIVAEENSFVSYLEGCTAPQYDKNQLHAAVVELYCAKGAEIKYSTVQNWYHGDEFGRGGIYNFVTKRGICDGAKSKISWTQVETGSAITWKYPSVVLKGDDTIGEFYSVALTKDYQQADTGTKMIHVGKNSRSKIVSKGISAGKSRNCYRGLVQVGPQADNAKNFSQCDSMLIGDTAGANTYPYIQGREILQSTVDLVQNNLNLEVIYGDTDSIMIYSGLDEIAKAKAIATKVIQEVNKKYRCLEIDLDGLYKRMLLLKKKKYAAVKVQFKDGTPYEVIERKGLDMVRRDWSVLSKEIGDFCLGQILSGGTCEDVVEAIHSSLMKVKEEMKNSEVALEKYVITKTLTKPPEDYPDAKNQPHVQVALRLKKHGYSGCSAGDTVPYIICCQDSSSASTGVAQRARHPDELKRDNENWMIDIDYYLSQQIHPVVSRLCASIQGTSPARLADCLGLDSSKFQKTVDSVSKDSTTVLLSVIDDNERYHGCEPLWLSCPSCACTFECPPASSLVSTLTNENPPESINFWCKMRCLRCPDDTEGCKISPSMIANQVKRQAENFIALYYKGTMTCDDEMCGHTTRGPNLRVVGDSERGTVCPNYPRCNGRLVRRYTEADLYKQLSYFCYVMDAASCIEKVDEKFRVVIEKELSTVGSAVDLAAREVRKIRDRCAYGWVQLRDLAVSLL